ncbi:MAG: TspO/MBR family protein [Patescibacteria group bacterium]
MQDVNRTWRLIASLGLVLFAGFLGSLANMTSLSTWYPGLVKPAFNPPNWIFGPVWTVLFVMMGISFFLIWNQCAKKKKNKDRVYLQSSMIFFSVQLAANVLWSFLFFFFQSPKFAFFEIILLWLTIALTIYYFQSLSRRAAWLLIPYLFWVSFATVLNFAIWQLN